ncbi:SDR family oxidoreductase [Luteimonas sp. MC1782]|uniref:SDR family NAD(P)-dependent oxidoreductase n=1 Tax=Luteimonas sp. MC1782 TaxID=2760305 RepID=UPI001602CB02|nr:SDR family oxidoreductase [Luteimonas sp. MC1782]MBB1471719.1 SDR family oxidoreductase [Luteimonas sp. MC1782]
MKIDLSGKTAIVTGSTGGIGLAITSGLADAGARVTIVGRTQARVDDALATLRAHAAGADVSGVVADVGIADGCATLIAARSDADILVNNLGIYGAQEFFAIDDALWSEYFEVNVLSGVRLARHYARGMRDRGWGRIQFISSESALNIPAEMVHYGVSKAALQGLSRGLAKVLAGTGVTVNTILPGPTRTGGAIAMMADLAAERGVPASDMEALFLAENRPSSLLKRFATPEEVANICVYAASPQASATTGAALRVEGGIVESIA